MIQQGLCRVQSPELVQWDQNQGHDAEPVQVCPRDQTSVAHARSGYHLSFSRLEGVPSQGTPFGWR